MLRDLFGVLSDKLVGFLLRCRRRGSANVSEQGGVESWHERKGLFLKMKIEWQSDFFFMTAPMTNVGVPVRTTEGD